jgi:hypothetical protein
MDVLTRLFVVLHLIGVAALLGGFLTQMGALRSGGGASQAEGGGGGGARIVPGMLSGAVTMLVTGMVLIGLNQAAGHPVSTVKMGVKLAVLVAVLGLVYVKRDEERLPAGQFGAIGALTTTNVFVAVLWT